MKTLPTSAILAGAAFALLAGNPAYAARRHAAGAGARWHVNHTVFEELPFDDGDLSYGLAYEYHDEAAYWQLAVHYTPDAGTNGTDYVVTPQINLIFKDRIWRLGVGALDSYVAAEDGGGDWGDVYWQLLTGLNLPLFRFQLNANAFYVFESWSDLDDFDTDDLEYGFWLTYPF